jgi:hypothetical protein
MLDGLEVGPGGWVACGGLLGDGDERVKGAMVILHISRLGLLEGGVWGVYMRHGIRHCVC